MLINKETVIISGGNGNIASLLAEKILSESEQNVLLLYHKNQDRVKAISSKYAESVFLLSCDINEGVALAEKINTICDNNRLIPVALVHTAALRSSDSSSLASSLSENWEKVIRTNVIGTYHLLKTVINLFHKDNAGEKLKSENDYKRIVLLGSDVSRIGLPYGSAYSASKAATANLCRSLSVELGAEKILINTVSPGPVIIDNSKFSPEYKKFRENYYNETLKKTPLGKLAQPADVVSLINYLISKENRHITGEEFFVTGGKR